MEVKMRIKELEIRVDEGFNFTLEDFEYESKVDSETLKKSIDSAVKAFSAMVLMNM